MTVPSFADVLLCRLFSGFRDVLRRSSVFSDRFSEGELKNLRDGFPPDEEPYTDYYEYLSDSDLDEVEDYTEADESLSDDTDTNPAHKPGLGVSDQEPSKAGGVSSLTTDRNAAEQAAAAAGDPGGRPGTTHTQPGKVAIIRDMAATT